MADRPIRIQRKRVVGSRMPVGAINCTRPGHWGNPYVIGKTYGGVRIVNAQMAVEAFQNDIDWNDRNRDRPMNAGLTSEEIRRELAGKDLTCWCGLAQACHVDVLLHVANDAATSGAG